MKNITNGYQYWATLVFFIIISIYTAFLLTPFFEQPPTNPYQIIGPTTELNYNPQNNTIRYFIITFGSIGLFYLLMILKHLKKESLINIFFILMITASFTLSQTNTFSNRVGNIDMFHDGEQLGVASGIHFFNKQPFSEQFFLHGFFTDPGIALLSFKLFGTSIGSYYFLTGLLSVISFVVFIAVLTQLIKDRFIFITLCFYLIIGGNSGFSFSRDVITMMWLLVSYLITTQKLSQIKGVFLATCISFISFYYSIDRAFYLFVSNGFFTFLIVMYHFLKQKSLATASKTILASFSGLLLAVLIGLVSFGFTSYKEFINITFFRIPQIKPFLDEYYFPALSANSLFPYWIPIFLIIGSFSLAIYASHKTKFSLESIFLLTINMLSLLYYRSAIGRNDLPHVIYVIHIIIISTIITGLITAKIEKTTITKGLVYILTVLIFMLPYIDYQKVLPPQFTTDELIQFATLPLTKDERWITSEQQEVSKYIKENSTITDTIFVYTNESAYYYLTERKNPTRFYTIWFASPNYYQREVITDLKKSKPKFIIYKNNYWSNNIDGISNQKRFPLLEKWMQEEYTLSKTIFSTEILSPK